jgi:hypothetical protein
VDRNRAAHVSRVQGRRNRSGVNIGSRPDWHLYGTTYFGGSTTCSTPLEGNLGCGTVFKLAPPSGGGAWTETVLHSWPNNRQFPYETVVVLHSGLLYGTTDTLGTKKLGSVFTLVP